MLNKGGKINFNKFLPGKFLKIKGMELVALESFDMIGYRPSQNFVSIG